MLYQGGYTSSNKHNKNKYICYLRYAYIENPDIWWMLQRDASLHTVCIGVVCDRAVYALNNTV